MTNQTGSRNSLGGSPAGVSVFRLRTLTLAAILFAGSAAAGFAQDKPDEAKAPKPAAEPTQKISHGYLIHQSLEAGGRYTTTSGSLAMWDTLVNQTSGGRILGQSLDMHSVNPSKTPFFDTLTTYSTGYGGDPYDVSRINISKGRFYDFTGTFRRDRNYFDYNLLVNSLLGPTALVPEPDSLHMFNTVRRNTDTTLTLMPLSRISYRAGFNHGTHEGPAFTTVHDGGDVQLAQWFRNASDTYTGGVDVKLFRRTTISYDQFYVLYKGDSTFQLPSFTLPINGNYPIRGGGGASVALGIDTLSTATCGSGANKTLEVVNGQANPYCSGSTTMSETAPTRTTFPTEQLRFSSHYWDKIYVNGRILYSGATGSVNNFNETFAGSARSTVTGDILRSSILTGGLGNGKLGDYKRINTNGDFAVIAEITKYLSLSDTVNFWNFRNSSNSVQAEEQWNTPNTNNILTPLSSITPTTATTPATGFLNQKIEMNTILATVTASPQVKLMGGWRFKNREITDPGDDLTWHENWSLLGGVFQPTRLVRINANYDHMDSASATADTPTSTFTREAPNKANHLQARATVKPAKWINFAIASNNYWAKNDDPLVNHREHNRDLSFATSLIPANGLSLDFNYAHDSAYSATDLCYIYTVTATTPPPPGATNAGTCVASASNPGGSASLLLGSGTYDVPSNFFSGSFNYAPAKYFQLNAGARVNSVNGTAEQLNPLMVPGALHSQYITPFTDLEVRVASQWSWHGNWTHDGYHEHGPQGLLPPRNTYGDILTLGLKYAF